MNKDVNHASKISLTPSLQLRRNIVPCMTVFSSSGICWLRAICKSEVQNNIQRAEVTAPGKKGTECDNKQCQSPARCALSQSAIEEEDHSSDKSAKLASYVKKKKKNQRSTWNGRRTLNLGHENIKKLRVAHLSYHPSDRRERERTVASKRHRTKKSLLE